MSVTPISRREVTDLGTAQQKLWHAKAVAKLMANIIDDGCTNIEGHVLSDIGQLLTDLLDQTMEYLGECDEPSDSGATG